MFADRTDTLFRDDPAATRRLAIMVAVSIALMVADLRLPQMTMVRSGLALAVSPLQWASHVPVRAGQWFDDTFASREELRETNSRLESQTLVLQSKVQKMVSLEAENIRLRELLNASAALDETVLVAEVVNVDPDPFTHKLIINRGSSDGVLVGQAVLDAKGLMGQVVQVDPFQSRVLLITDSGHAIPVQVGRNGIRAVAAGTSPDQLLELMHVPDTADIRVGDALFSSGMGRRFPPRYPVALVHSVEHFPGRPFAKVLATPSADLDRSRHVLLVYASASQKAAAVSGPEQE